ncbi:hypothetical protein [Deinococcus roseus]|uniref:Uncharacterized protein n=1 Tax=Deinococcus roseus TaxID=392414 RepID=A0ABQ2DGU8_9DEIO|nr:hypothetical protein [Deinococcus roseus]GGJ53985.1 hypothetical protein GCM10008938_45070 [Deinococcus roseus]
MSTTDQALTAFHKRNRKALDQTARELQKAGIARIYFGLNFYNDEGDPADYSVVEKLDGSVETLDHWHPLLDLQLFSSVPYCNAYVFQVGTASVEPDLQGGLIDVAEADMRAYHTPEQKQAWEELAEEMDEGLDMETQMWLYNDAHQEEFASWAEQLTERGWVRVYFGIDAEEDRYPLSGYVLLEASEGDVEPQDALPDFMDADVFEDLPQYGAFVFDAGTQSVSVDLEGGMVESEKGWTRAYHTPEERDRLERLAAQEN